MLDVACLVPFQPAASGWIDKTVRGAFASKRIALRARDRFLEYVGSDLLPFLTDGRPHRSLTAVVLATGVERAGLRWRVFDPGVVPISDWRRFLEALRPDPPRVIAISTTFVIDAFAIGALCALARQILPHAKLVIGGYYYGSDSRQFLSFDADVLCVGEGEERLAQIAVAVRDGNRLDGIPGLYLRDDRGVLSYTGDPAPLSLDALARPDWSLAPRIEPPIDLTREPITYSVETQRGCLFKCEFCTYRTLARPDETSIEHAVARIREPSLGGHGSIFLIDATGTHPRDRWRAILERLISEGGSRLPISVFARVNDLDDEVCRLMARAGVRRVLIGQESGDQRMLDAMRKGTRVAHVAPAMAALARHGIVAQLLFFFGFPGETEESMRATRLMLAGINDGLPAPTALFAHVELFGAMDFAAVSQRDATSGGHRLSWGQVEVSPSRAAEEILRTNLALSRLPNAPATGFGVMPMPWELWHVAGVEREFFPWAKAIDRGIGLFLAEELEGRRVDHEHLARVRAEVRARLPRLRGARVVARGLSFAKRRLTWRLTAEWEREHDEGIGILTRTALAREVWRALGRIEPALQAFRTGEFPRVGVSEAVVDTPAQQLVRLGIENGRRKAASRLREQRR